MTLMRDLLYICHVSLVSLE